MKTYSEHEKLDKVKDQSQTIGEFLDYLQNEEKVTLKKYVKEYIYYHEEDFERQVKEFGEDTPKGRELRYNNPDKWSYEGGWLDVRKSIEQMLSEYFKIDLIKLEEEKREMLADIRSPNHLKA